MKENMSAYLKIQNVRASLSKLDLKKSGKNDHNGFTFIQTPDFMPQANQLMAEQKVCGVFSLSGETAKLEIIDSENPESRFAIEIPIVQAQLPKAQPIQSLGGTISYLRRYCWILALELTVEDEVDQLPQTGQGGMAPPFKPLSAGYGKETVSRESEGKPLENLSDDLPEMTLEERIAQINSAINVDGLNRLFKSYPKDVRLDQKIINACADRKIVLTEGPKEIHEEKK